MGDEVGGMSVGTDSLFISLSLFTLYSPPLL